MDNKLRKEIRDLKEERDWLFARLQDYANYQYLKDGTYENDIPKDYLYAVKNFTIPEMYIKELLVTKLKAKGGDGQ